MYKAKENDKRVTMTMTERHKTQHQLTDRQTDGQRQQQQNNDTQ